MLLWQVETKGCHSVKASIEIGLVYRKICEAFFYGLMGGGTMLLKECSRCGNLIPYGATYCKGCAPIVEAEREARRVAYKREGDRRYNKTRDPKYTRFYNSIDWRTLSAKYTQDKQYKCESCGAIATQVHHKQAIQTPDGWERRLDYTNLELLCGACHNERHDRFKRRHTTDARAK